ncbi:MAG: PQQ-binding-like beta-propeller repeat protein [Pseudomonadota bacterium]|nr:PQQ-binding-like beta-propeller repeat protein [Pseudomonadota bacterium]
MEKRPYIVRLIGMIALSVLLTGCGGWLGGETDIKLEGKRINVLRGSSNLQADARISDLDVILPRPEVNREWPQSGGYPNHAMHHLAVSGPLTKIWKIDIGKGSNDEAQLLSEPIIAGNIVYTLDTQAEISAIDARSGNRLWQVELSKDDDNEGILGGGLAFEGGRLFATTGFAEIIALDAKSGREIWRKRLNAPIRAAPTVWAGRVFVVTTNNELHALAAADGREFWTHSGLSEVAGLVGGAPPAVDAGVVVVPYSSGEVAALRVENGRQVWIETLTALQRSDAVTAMSHIRGRPVIDRGIVYVVGNGNRTVAVDLRTGTRLWEVRSGGRNGAWVAGNFIYIVTRDAELVCLTRQGGRVRWISQLPRYDNEEDQEDAILWSGPVLAGDRILIGNTQEEIWSLSPYNGKFLGRIAVSGPILIAPVVARETVYVLTDEAELIAFR